MMCPAQKILLHYLLASERFHITKLTVDRLWCYVPEVESWIKAEDVSYNQSGKLYNALDIDVIHLDELDFSTITSLDGVGIYPQKRLLYFHDREDYVYEGEYTYDAFSALHELEFVYPETIYIIIVFITKIIFWRRMVGRN